MTRIEYMARLFALAMIGIAVGAILGKCCLGQSTIEQITVAVKTVEVAYLDDVELGSRELSTSESQAVAVTPEFEGIRKVRAFPKQTFFPPVALQKTADGRYVLYGEQGKSYWVEIDYQDNDEEWLQVTVGSKGPKPPDKPDPDPEPDPDPFITFAEKLDEEISKLSDTAQVVRGNLADNVATIRQEWNSGKYKGESFFYSLRSMSVALNTLNQQTMGDLREQWVPVWQMVQTELQSLYDEEKDKFDTVEYLNQLELGLRGQ